MCCILWDTVDLKNEKDRPGAGSWLQGVTCKRHADPCMPGEWGSRRLFAKRSERVTLGKKQLSRNPRIHTEIAEGTFELSVVWWGRFDMVCGKEGQRKVLQGRKLKVPAISRREQWMINDVSEQKSDSKNKSLKSTLGSFKGRCV